MGKSNKNTFISALISSENQLIDLVVLFTGIDSDDFMVMIDEISTFSEQFFIDLFNSANEGIIISNVALSIYNTDRRRAQLTRSVNSLLSLQYIVTLNTIDAPIVILNMAQQSSLTFLELLQKSVSENISGLQIDSIKNVIPTNKPSSAPSLSSLPTLTPSEAPSMAKTVVPITALAGVAGGAAAAASSVSLLT